MTLSKQFKSVLASTIGLDPAFKGVFKSVHIPHSKEGYDDVPAHYSDLDYATCASFAEGLINEIASGRPVRKFFDNDGTLFRFNPDPLKTKMDRACYAGLVRLSQYKNFLATSLTGRDIKEAAELMLTPGYEVRDSTGRILAADGDKTLRFSITGSHGVENLSREGIITRHDFGPAADAFIASFKKDSVAFRAKYAGIHIEDGKHGAVGINVRTIDGSPELKARAYAEVLAMLQAYEGSAHNPSHPDTGKSIFNIRKEGSEELEMRPVGYGKDFGIRTFGKPERETLTLFIGDSFKQPDGTDIDAARLINNKDEFARGHVLMVRNGRFEPDMNDDAVRPRFIFANPTMVGNFLCYVADKVEALAPRPQPVVTMPVLASGWVELKKL